MSQKACFLDRDGVINVEKHYLHDPALVELERDVIPALRKLREAGFLLIVVTNQAGVAKGLYPESDIPAVHAEIDRILNAAGVKIDGYYYCPHHPDLTGPCDCRKPSPGMLLRAAREHDIDLKQSYMIGDRISDLEAGRNAGVARSILVKTGYGVETLKKAPLPAEFPIAETLLDACDRWIAPPSQRV